MEPFTEKIFRIIDKEIEKILESDEENYEVKLTELYFRFWKDIKDVCGTSSGFTGLSEYVFLRAIQLLLERRGIDIKYPLAYTKKSEKNDEVLTKFFSSKNNEDMNRNKEVTENFGKSILHLLSI